MAYKQIGPEEWLIGYIPRGDCSDLDPGRSISYAELIDLLLQERIPVDEVFLIKVAGKLGSPDRECSAPSFVTRRRNVLSALREEMDSQRGAGNWTGIDAGVFALDPANVEGLIERLVMLTQPPYLVTGIVVKRAPTVEGT